MAAKTRRTYAGAAASTTITAGINSSDTTITLTAATGWAAGPFYVVIDPGTASEEKVYISSRSTTTLTVSARGVDGTTAKSHSAGAVIYPVHAAVDSDEANELTSTYTTRGDIVYQGASTFTRLGVGTADQVLKTNGTDPSWGQVATGGIADDAVTAAKIASGAVGTSELANDAVTADKIAAGAVAASELASDAVTTVKILDANVTTAKIADANVTLAKLATAVQNALVPVGTIAMYGGASAPTGWLLCDGTSTTGYPTLAGIVGSTTPDLRGRFALGDNTTLTLLGTGGSTTIGTNNLPSHSHANTATASTSVSISDPTHDHNGGTQAGGDHIHSNLVESTSSTSHTHSTSGTAGSTSGTNTEGSDNTANSGEHYHVISAASTGITATATTTVTMSNASTGGGEAYYQPYLVVNYIIKHD